ncbi:MAG TPA: arylsulfatase [Jiangellaceae bacterium]|nr:arylsulfatase [Jiangellaceae bacterium]
MSESIQRETLPIPDPAHVGLTTFDAKDPNTVYPPIVPLRPPAGAPNVLIVLVDDVGFGASSAYGGPCNTPTAERLAAGGLQFTRFHTTALCAPTRQALLTGRNHHSVAMGAITEMATSAPGQSSVRPKNKAPLAETLKLNGYSTAQFGKCHEVPAWETSPMGPFHQWPTGSGFEYFYGFIGGEANQWFPGLFEGTSSVEPPKTPEEGYHLTEDLADHAVSWIRQQKSLMPDKPFFIYFAPGATHAPHHVPADWVERNRGRFDAGWDAQRQETFARQKELGVIPADAELTARPAAIPGWDDMDEELKPILRREMEIYAGFLEHTDHHIGRVIDAIDDVGALEDTLIYYIIGDNGASAEGTIRGCFNEMTTLNGMPGIETTEFLLSKIDDFATTEAYNHYAVGWAHAMNTPYQWTKQIASHWGGTRNGTIVHWPNGIAAKGEKRNQFHHVIDVAPTVLAAASLPAPASVNGIAQAPLEGFSMLASFADADAAESHDLQYFEMFGNRGVYHQGWTAVTRHSIPWTTDPMPAFDDDVWELYGPDDWTQSNDLAADQPDKLAELQRLWLIEAVKYNVLPLDDRRYERINAELAGRPELVTGQSQLLFPGMRVNEWSALNMKNKSHSVTAQITVPDDGGEGVIVAQGGKVGGWALYVHDGNLKYCVNFFGIEQFFAESTEPLPPGDHQVRMESSYDGDGLAKGADITLYVDGQSVGTGRAERTIPMAFSADEGLEIGQDLGSPSSPDYGARGNEFNGTIAWVQLDAGTDDQDHLITPEERFNLAMAKQ